MLWAAAIQTVATVGVGLAGSFWLAVALYLIVMGTMGVWGLGRLAQNQSIAAGYVVGGLTTVFVLPVIFILRRQNEQADIIVGTAGKQGACAAQGIPNISAVDANSHVMTVEA